MLSIIELNSLDYEQFIMEFGNVVEKCPAISGALWDYRPFNSISHLIFTISCIISELPDSGRCCVKLSEKKNSLKKVSKNCFFFLVKAGILRGIPDLGGRLAQTGQLAKESAKEQSQAGLNCLSNEERILLAKLNELYKAKFGFPFVICARLNRKDAILKNLRVRYPNGIEKELNIAINQVLKICELRIRDIISSQCMLQSKL